MEAAAGGVSRRTIFKGGMAAAALLALGGGAAWRWRSGLQGAHLSESGRAIFRAVGRAVLEGSLPADGVARERALDVQLRAVDDLLAGLPAATRTELGLLLGLLSVTPGRRWLTGLDVDWPEADVAAVEAALRRMRTDPQALRQQAYHALRDLSNAAFYAQPAQWALLGYPGPTPLRVAAHD